MGVHEIRDRDGALLAVMDVRDERLSPDVMARALVLHGVWQDVGRFLKSLRGDDAESAAGARMLFEWVEREVARNLEAR